MTTTAVVPKEVLKALKLAVARRSPVQILSDGVLVQVTPGTSEQGRVRLTATDLDVSFTAVLPASSTDDGGEPFGAIFSLKQFLALMKYESRAVFGKTADGVEVISSPDGASISPMYPAEEYPSLPDAGEGEGGVFEFPYGEAAQRLMAAVGEDSRYYLSGFQVKQAWGTCWMFATDGHRLHCEQLGRYSQKVGDFLVPAKAFEIIHAAFEKRRPRVTLLTSDQGKPVVVAKLINSDASKYSLTWRQPDAQFPECVNVVERTMGNSRYRAHLDAAGVKALEKALDRILVLQKNEPDSHITWGVGFQIGRSEFRVYRYSKDKRGDMPFVEIPCETSKARMSEVCGVNGWYLRDVIRKEKRATIEVRNPESAFYITVGDSSRALVMPCRIEGTSTKYPYGTEAGEAPPIDEPGPEDAPEPEPEPPTVKFTIESPVGGKLGEFTVPEIDPLEAAALAALAALNA